MAGGLTFGSVDLFGGSGLSVEFLGNDAGTSWGNAVPVTEQLQTFLQYGSIVVNNGWETREVVVVVRVKGNGPAMADAEAALFAEVGKPNTLTYTPPASGAAATVFRVIYSQLENTPDDLAEVLAKKRVYTIRLICEPFAYSAVLTNVAALAASGSETDSVDTGSSTTGWTAKVNGSAVSPSTSGGAVVATSGSALAGTATVAMTRTGAITTSSTKYLVVDWKVAAGTVAQSFSATDGTNPLTKIAEGSSPTSGYTRSTFLATTTSIPALVLTSITSAPTGGAGVNVGGTVARSMSIDNISRTDIRPSLGTARQQIRTLPIAGSAPTIGSLAVEHSTTSLGDVLIYTYPDDGSSYVPPCRNYRVSSAVGGTDATAVSGSSDTLDPTTPLIYDVPVAALPVGEYEVWVRYSSSTGIGSPSPSTITWDYAPRLNGVNLASATSNARNVAGASSYSFGVLGRVTLPSIDMAPSASAVMRFTLKAPASPVVVIDELYLINVQSGRLTVVTCGAGTAASGGPANRLWIDSPAIENNGWGRYLMGFSADRSDAYSSYPSMLAQGIHDYPGGKSLKVFTVATNPTTAADVAFAYYAAWSNHAGS